MITLQEVQEIQLCGNEFCSRPNASLAVVFGEFDISDNKSLTEDKPIVEIKVKRITVHPGFNNRTLDDDLAILELENPVRYDTHIGKNNL